MTGALSLIAATFFLSASSLLLILLRVSPLTVPEIALPLFFLSFFIALSSLCAFLIAIARVMITRKPFVSSGYVVSSLRQGMFIGAASSIVIFLHLLQILNWWIAVLIYAVFVLVEMAVGR